MDAALLIARLILALAFAVAGAAKLADLDGARSAAAGFGVPARLVRPVSVALPVVEFATVLALVIEPTARAGAIAALVLLGAFAVAIAWAMARGKEPDCHCFGQLHSARAGPRTLARNLVLACLAAFAAFAGDDAGPGLGGDIGSPDAVLVGALIAVVALLVALMAGALAYLRLLRRHGELLLRIETLEAMLSRQAAPRIPEPGADRATRSTSTRARRVRLPEGRRRPTRA